MTEVGTKVIFKEKIHFWGDSEEVIIETPHDVTHNRNMIWFRDSNSGEESCLDIETFLEEISNGSVVIPSQMTISRYIPKHKFI